MDQTAVTLVEQALAYSREADSPGSAARFMPEVRDLLKQAVPALKQGERITRLVFPSEVPLVTLTSGGVVTDSARIEMAFPATGWVVGLFATVIEGHELCSKVSVKMTINDVPNLFTTARGESACPLSILAAQDPRSSNLFRIRKYVYATARWYFQFTSQSKLYPASGTQSFTPIIAAAFVEDEVGTNR